MDDISEDLLEDCAQLVKANSIQGPHYEIGLYLKHVFVFYCWLQEC
jgi:uncharacterized protein YktB (UPF0637 family)